MTAAIASVFRARNRWSLAKSWARKNGGQRRSGPGRWSKQMLESFRTTEPLAEQPRAGRDAVVGEKEVYNWLENSGQEKCENDEKRTAELNRVPRSTFHSSSYLPKSL
eukprot:GHVT01041710.1.p1 GENE.GHVT01041710.1~~GHVT01041710.1.p1  ORF type:complete len:108 (+),score=17.25 GHVT01041710.1:75-398(+)